jgi:hypothetical protein
MEMDDLAALGFRWAVLFAHCVGATVLTASLVDEREDDSDDDGHEHEEPQIRIHSGIVRLTADGRQRRSLGAFYVRSGHLAEAVERCIYFDQNRQVGLAVFEDRSMNLLNSRVG